MRQILFWPEPVKGITGSAGRSGKMAPVIVLPGDAEAREQSQKPASDLERCDDQSGCRFFAGEARIESARLKDPLVLCAWL